MATYNIGPSGTPTGTDGHVYSTICQPTTGFQGWGSLQPGDTVNIYAKPSLAPYYECFLLTQSGTSGNPITINGVSDGSGNQPIIDGGAGSSVFGAQFNSTFNSNYLYAGGGSGVLYILPISGNSTAFPSWININNLHIRGAYSGNTVGGSTAGPGGPNTYTHCDGTTKVWADFTGAIFAGGVINLNITNCSLTDSGQGLYLNASNYNVNTNVLIQGCYFNNNGMINQDHMHQSYCEALGITYQYNWYGPQRSGGGGAGLKDRSAGCIIRYNYFQSPSTGTDMLDLVDAEDQPSAIGGVSAYNSTFVYGNILDNTGANASNTMIWFGGDSTTEPYRPNCYFYYNTVVMNYTSYYLYLLNLAANNVTETFYSCNNIWYLTPNTTLLNLGEGTVNFYPTDWMTPGVISNQGATINGTSNLTSPSNNNPGFVNFSTGNYNLASGSSAIGVAGSMPSQFTSAYGWGSTPAAGFRDAAGLPTKQLNYFGNPIPYGLTGTTRSSINDLGAYAYVSSGSPTTATLSGPTTGALGVESTSFSVNLDQPAGVGGVVIAPTSTIGTDTFQATISGSNVTIITIAQGSSSGTFYLTPLTTSGSRNIAITTSPLLTYSGSPVSYNAIVIAPTTATLSGPTTGVIGVLSTNLTVTLDHPAGSGGVIVTLASNVGTDTFPNSTYTIAQGSTITVFQFTPITTTGNRSITITTSPSLTYSGSPLTYNATAVATTATLTGPTSGTLGTESTNFTVTLDHPAGSGGVVVTLASNIGTDTFPNPTYTIAQGSTTTVFQFTPLTTSGNRNITIITSPSLTYSGSPVVYNASGVSATIAILTGPTSGELGQVSTIFTVTLNAPAGFGGIVITPSSSVGTDYFTS